MKFNLSVEEINYIKILYKDKFNFAHYLKAAIQKLESKYIFAGVKSEKRIVIETPQEVTLSFISDNGLYKSKTTLNFVRYDEQEEYLFFSFITPEEVEYQQNREYFRVLLQDNAVVEYEQEGKKQFASAQIHDISANGVCITISEPIDFPENVKLYLKLQSKEITTSAKFVRTDDEEGSLKVSFHFSNIDTHDLDYISRMCLKKQIENRRKSFS